MALPLTRPSLRRQDFDLVLDAMVHDRLSGGEVNRTLTKEISRSLALREVYVLASVGEAVRVILLGLGLEPGDRVVLSPLAPSYWAHGLERLGLVAVYCDVESDSPVISGAKVESLATAAKAIIADCNLGFLPDITSLVKTGLFVVEDISQGMGGEWNGLAGTQGHAVLMHFSPHSLVAGAGGCAVGFRSSSAATEPAEWELLSDLGAALVLSQWKDAQVFAEKKREHFRRLFLRLKGYRSPKQLGEGLPVFPWFPLLVEQGAKDLLAHARKHAVEADWAYRNQHHLANQTDASFCPNARAFLFKTILFPLYANISERDLTDLGKVLSSLP